MKPCDCGHSQENIVGEIEMLKASRFRSSVVAIFTVLALIAAAESSAQHSNPYRAYYGWAKLPEGRVQGVVGAIWVAVLRAY